MKVTQNYNPAVKSCICILLIFSFMIPCTARSNDVLKKEVIINKAIELLPFYKNSQCFDKKSKFYGCSYPAHWRGITNKPDARYQEIAYYYAFLYKNYDNDQELLKRAIAAMEFWGGLQKYNGLVPEYPMTKAGGAATAFGAAVMARTVMLLDKDLPEKSKKKMLFHINKSLSYFLKHDFNDMPIYGTNQKLGVLFALTSGYHLTNNSEYIERYRELKKWVIKNEVDKHGLGLEGSKVNEKWYDYSYVELLMWFFIYQNTGDPEAFEIGSKLANTLSLLIDPQTGKSIVGRDTTGVHSFLAWSFLMNSSVFKTLGEEIFIKNLRNKSFHNSGNRYIFSMWWEFFPVYLYYPLNEQRGVYPLSDTLYKKIDTWTVISTGKYIFVYDQKKGLIYYSEKSIPIQKTKFILDNKNDGKATYYIFIGTDRIARMIFDENKRSILKYEIFKKE
ncbi:hypothetical protein H206_02380 [Candidatus Electrothrix aarhusensis]|uniref:D-glucuronyl C5-epimerase C-terminal domain-containing protein n=1 Tax=Candidatus Electrothrix aarhusensis TaxID=1859131 RepID=A0A3S4T853_9BACT|nr:hypothetical protein H206_02380 [Candidatus Electrothrix aarhusensis]